MSKTKALKRPARSRAKRPAAAKTVKSAAKKAGAGKSASGKSAPKKTKKTVATGSTARKKVAAKKVASKASTKKVGAAATTSKPSKKAAVKPAAKRAGKVATKSAVSRSRTSKTTAVKATAKAKAATKSTPRKPASVKKAASKSMVTTKSRAKSRALKPDIKLPEGYRPSDKEPFMSDLHQVYFRNKLVAWKEDIIRQTRETLIGLTSASEQHADVADRATSETDRALELRARDRQRKLVSKINSALARIEEGLYGYCEETGEPIGLRRLEARPIATLSLEAQERHERRERVFRED